MSQSNYTQGTYTQDAYAQRATQNLMLRSVQTNVRNPSNKEKWTLNGKLSFFACFLVAASAFPSMRLPLGGLLVHLYLLCFPPMILLLVKDKAALKYFPRRTAFLLTAFFAIYTLACLPSSRFLSEMVKISSIFFGMVLISLNIKTSKDYRYAVLAFVIAVAIIASKGLLQGDSGLKGINPLAGIGNKNAFGLFAAPAILHGTMLLLKEKASLLIKACTAASILLIIAAVFSSGSRAAWVGVVVIIGSFILKQRNIKTFIFALVLGLGVYYIIDNYTSLAIIEHRFNMTVSENHSDEIRKMLVEKSFQIGLENPVLGVSPDVLFRKLAIYTRVGNAFIMPHNVYAYMMGATGLICTGFYLLFLLSMMAGLSKKRWHHLKWREDVNFIIRLSVLVFLFQGLFTHEILYSPGVSLGLGLALAYQLQTLRQKVRL